VPSSSGSARAPSTVSTTEGSGLIDIRSMAARTIASPAERRILGFGLLANLLDTAVLTGGSRLAAHGGERAAQVGVPVLGVLALGIVALGFGIYR